jgi:hypothetical protein
MVEVSFRRSASSFIFAFRFSLKDMTTISL